MTRTTSNLFVYLYADKALVYCWGFVVSNDRFHRTRWGTAEVLILRGLLPFLLWLVLLIAGLLLR